MKRIIDRSEEDYKSLDRYYNFADNNDGRLLRAIKNSIPLNECDDCISRQTILDMTGLSEWFDSSDSYNEFAFEVSKMPPVYPKKDKSCDDCMWQVCNYNKMIDYNKLLKEVSDKIEDYVCNHVKDHAKAQGMCDALTMIEDYIKENVNGKID